MFSEFGLPFSLLCDNGNPWGTSQSTGYTTFEVWLMELGVLTLHGRPLHPQTQGKQERFNRSFTRECLAGMRFGILRTHSERLILIAHFTIPCARTARWTWLCPQAFTPKV